MPEALGFMQQSRKTGKQLREAAGILSREEWLMSLFKDKATQAEGLLLSLPPKVVKVERVWTIKYCHSKAHR